MILKKKIMNKDKMFQNDFSYCKKSKQICKSGQRDCLEYTLLNIDKNIGLFSNIVFKVVLFQKERSILSLHRYINPQYIQTHPILLERLRALHEVNVSIRIFYCLKV